VTILAAMFTTSVLLATRAELPASAADYLRRAVDNGVYVGAIVALVDGNQVTIQSFGKASREAGSAPDTNTAFAIGSITKTFTGILLASEVLAGRMQLDAPVQNFLPANVTIPQVGDRPMTIASLATHLSGLPNLPPLTPATTADPFADFNDAKLWEAVGKVKLPRAPGATSEYSNFGYGLLGTLIGRAATKSYDALVSERIFGPLGMTRSHLTPNDAKRQPIAQGYNQAGKSVPHWTFQSIAGASAIYSTTTDMLAYLRANMAVAARTAPATPLHQAMALAQEPRADMGGNKIGLGWITTSRGIRLHDGGTAGFSSVLGFTVDGKRGVIVLTNTLRPEITGRVGLHLLDSTLPLPPLPTTVVLAPEVLEPYVGRYMVAPGQHVTVTPRENGITIRLPGQEPYPVFASGPDRFSWQGVPAEARFERDASGRITRMVLRQNGLRLRWPRLGDDDRPVPQATPRTPTAAELDGYVGRYQLTRQAVLTITRDGDRLMAQLPGTQQPLPVFSETPDRFEFETLDADLAFERDAGGTVIAVKAVIGQNDVRATRLP
jgi:CubicO group peptidase (beta-lactamase class C family)